jgi:hypothetical protein
VRNVLKRSALAAAAALVAVALAACSGIPTSGSVQAGPELGTSGDNINVIFLPTGPTDGMSQQDILSGFIQAQKSPQNNYSVARSYLSSGFSDTWKPNAGATVDTGTPSTSSTGDTSMQMSVTPVAYVDANGSYTESGSSAPATLDFTFVQQGGQWRISAAPDGVLIEDVFFDQVFSSHALYFYDPTFTFLVPDLRWFPTSTAVGTRIVQALLAGPSAWLGNGAVVTAFPDGTSTSSVVTTGGQAQVPLSSNVLQSSTTDLQRMQLQLEASLGAVATVANVTITVDQNVVQIPGSGQPGAIQYPRVNASPLVERDGAFGYLAGNGVSSIAGISDPVESLKPVAVSYSSSRDVAAVKADAGGVYVVRSGSDPVQLDQRAGLIAPSVDPFGYVWSIASGDPTGIIAYGPDNAAILLSTNWDGASGITSFEVSRDGTRALAYLTADGQSKLVVAAIIRNPSGVPQKLGQPVVLSTGPETPIDATWIDQLDVASVSTTPAGTVKALSLALGGRSTSLGTPSSAVAAAGGNDVDGLRVLATDGSLLQQRGSAWQSTATGITRLGVQTY